MKDTGSYIPELICPESQLPLLVVPEELLANINGQIRRDALYNRSKRKITTHLDAGLMSAAGRLIYPVINGIPLLLVNEAIEIPPGN